eukprot:scaffold528_cov389-Prasinococcus_capsulatus_cf.AAC.3
MYPALALTSEGPPRPIVDPAPPPRVRGGTLHARGPAVGTSLRAIVDDDPVRDRGRCATVAAAPGQLPYGRRLPSPPLLLPLPLRLPLRLRLLVVRAALASARPLLPPSPAWRDWVVHDDQNRPPSRG